MNKKKLLEITKQFVSNEQVFDEASINAALVLKKAAYQQEKKEMFDRFDDLRNNVEHKILNLYKSNKGSGFEERIESFMKAALSEKTSVFDKNDKKEIRSTMLDDEIIRAFLREKRK